eukprot:scpid29911/ scgid22664/ Acyl-CoA dehydrogenase family member 10
MTSAMMSCVRAGVAFGRSDVMHRTWQRLPRTLVVQQRQQWRYYAIGDLVVPDVRRDVRAVIFVAQNVLIRLDRNTVRQVEGQQNVPRGATVRAMIVDGDNTASSRWKRGELHGEDPAFLKQLRADMRRHGPVYKEFDVRAIMKANIQSWISQMPDPVVDSLVCMRAEGIRLALITDMGYLNANKDTHMPQPSSLFDVIIEPCRIGKRKGDADVYEMAIDQLKVPAEHCLYFDPYMVHNAVAKSLGLLPIPVSRCNFFDVFEPVAGFKVQGYVAGTVAVRDTDSTGSKALLQAANQFLQLPSTEKVIPRRFLDRQQWLQAASSKGEVDVTSFHLRSGQLEFLLRCQTESDPSPSSVVLQEARLLQLLHRSGVSVPEVVHISDDSSLLGGPYYLCKYVSAEASSSVAATSLSANRTKALYQSMCQSLVNLHSIKLDDGTASLEFVSKQEDLSSQIKELTREFASCKTHDIASMDYLVEWLAKNIPSHAADVSPTLVHTDYRLDNLVVMDTGESVSAVVPSLKHIAVGNPLANLADNCVAYHVDDGLPCFQGLVGVDLDARGIPSEDDYIASYCEQRGLEHPSGQQQPQRRQLPDWTFYMVLALFKQAVHAQRTFHSALNGTFENSDAFSLGPVVECLADAGMELTLPVLDDGFV